MVITTIKLSRETKERLDKIKEYRRETYDDTIRKMLGILTLTKINPEKAKSILLRIDSMHKKEKKKTQKKI